MTHKLIKTDNYILVVDDSVHPYDSSKVGNPLAHLPLNGSPILEGVDLLPALEDDVEEIAHKEVMDYLTDGNPEGDFTKSTIGAYGNKIWWIKGYNKAREKYKYTEEDMRKAISETRKGMLYNKMYEDEYIQSLHQYPTEFECEMEDYCGSPLTTDRCPKCIDSCDRAYQRPKTITTAQGIQWVGKYK
jgi:hypothetical protein